MEEKHLIRQEVDKDSKTVLVALHGLASGKEAMQYFIKDLTGVKEIVYLDLPGNNGLMPDKNYKSTIDDAVDYVLKFVDEFREDIILIGFSLGGIVTQRFIERFGGNKRILGGIVWASPLHGLTPGEIEMGTFQNRMPSFVHNLKFKWIAKNLAKIFGYKLSDRDISDALLSQKASIKRYYYAIDSFRPSFELNSKPTLLIYDPTDPWISNADMEEANNAKCENDQIDVKIINGSGHFHSKEDRKEALNEVQNFISKFSK